MHGESVNRREESMKKLLFCVLTMGITCIIGMHEQQGPYAYAYFKKVLCYSGYCMCGSDECRNKNKMIVQEKVAQVSQKASPMHRSLQQ